MADAHDPTDAIRRMAADYPDVAKGTSCNQNSFKVGKGSFLFIGPGAKGQGYKAMFKLGESMRDAEVLAAEEPDRFEVGSSGWVTTRFTAEEPLPGALWEAWLDESYELTRASGKGSKRK